MTDLELAQVEAVNALRSLLNGIESGMVRVETDADEALEWTLKKGRAAINIIDGRKSAA